MFHSLIRLNTFNATHISHDLIQNESHFVIYDNFPRVRGSLLTSRWFEKPSFHDSRSSMLSLCFASNSWDFLVLISPSRTFSLPFPPLSSFWFLLLMRCGKWICSLQCGRSAEPILLRRVKESRLGHYTLGNESRRGKQDNAESHGQSSSRLAYPSKREQKGHHLLIHLSLGSSALTRFLAILRNCCLAHLV